MTIPPRLATTTLHFSFTVFFFFFFFSLTMTNRAVFLSNVDDYLAPSQACVNPLYTNNSDVKTAAESIAPAANNSSNNNNNNNNNNNDTVVSRRKRTRFVRPSLPTTQEHGSAYTATLPQQQLNDVNNKSDSVVKASIADCLACSGCITTAETVLLEDHSLDKLRHVIGQQQQQQHTRIIATISAASMAELCRYTQLETTTQLVSWLIQALQLYAVVDGSLALQWSLHMAAQEFVQKKRQQEQEQEQTRLISSSCPAVVCLAEKNLHDCVPRLSTIKSPMLATGAAILSSQSQSSSSSSSSDSAVPNVFHLAIMPCHDKKLEASRASNQQQVNLSITTEECWQLLQETTTTTTTTTNNTNTNNSDPNNNNKKHWWQDHVASLPPARVTSDWKSVLRNIREEISNSNNSNNNTQQYHTTSYFVTLKENTEHMNNSSSSSSSRMEVDNDNEETTTTTATRMIVDMDSMAESIPPTSTSSTFPHNDTFSPYSSGGYADYIFCHAAKELFGVVVENVPWQPVTSSVVGPGSTVEVVSARVAKSRPRDFYQAILYQDTHLENGETIFYTTTPMSLSAKPVLKFAIAYGMQTMQRALARSDFDYVEAMACPSGCLNGGGQLLIVGNGRVRESPKETQARIQAVKEKLVVPTYNRGETRDGAVYDGPLDNMTTFFQAVQPMEVTMGAAKGTAIQNMQW
jgi:iron only hydrogenase large subunit-like protein